MLGRQHVSDPTRTKSYPMHVDAALGEALQMQMQMQLDKKRPGLARQAWTGTSRHVTQRLAWPLRLVHHKKPLCHCGGAKDELYLPAWLDSRSALEG